MKKINCHMASDPKYWENEAREEVKAITSILDKYATDDGFEEYAEANTVGIIVGNDIAKTIFKQRTWEAAEDFIVYCICFLIVDSDLDRFPYYAEMLDRYTKSFRIDRENLDD